MTGWPWKLLDERRQEFLDKRASSALTDEEFSEYLDLPDPTFVRLVSILRRIIARDCGVPADRLLPNDTLDEINSIMGASGIIGWLFGGPYGYDFHSMFYSLIKELEQEIGEEPPIRAREFPILRSFPKGDLEATEPNPSILGDFIRSVCIEIHSVLASHGVEWNQ